MHEMQSASRTAWLGLGNEWIRRPARAATCAALVLSFASHAGAPDSGFAVVHSFERSEGTRPEAALVSGPDGWVYGTATSGGAFDAGAVFRVSLDGLLAPVHAFHPDQVVRPLGMVLARDGHFYGVSLADGRRLIPGAAFRISPAGEVTVLHTFVQERGECFDPRGTLLQGADGDFYGTTMQGGRGEGCIFRLRSTGEFTVLHVFDETGGEPWHPQHGLIQASDGRLYGTTYNGQFDTNGGAIFRIHVDGSGFEVLHGFGVPDPIGEFPGSGLTDGKDGWLYGVTLRGGPWRKGAVYRVNLSGEVQLVYGFGSAGPEDGATPGGELLLASDGHFYGVTSAGGKHGAGTVFQMTRGGRTRLIHQFAGSPPHAFRPGTALIETSAGDLVGTTSRGGRYNQGTIYKLRMGGQKGPGNAPLPRSGPLVRP